MMDSSLPGWHRLCEYYVPAEPESEFLPIEKITETVKGLGLEDTQVRRIWEAIWGSIQEIKSSEDKISDQSAVLIRLWVPDMVSAEASQIAFEDHTNHQKGPNGLGFFLVEKTVGEPGNPWKVSCRIVDVLIYGK
jgi:hypothetical protein